MIHILLSNQNTKYSQVINCTLSISYRKIEESNNGCFIYATKEGLIDKDASMEGKVNKQLNDSVRHNNNRSSWINNYYDINNVYDEITTGYTDMRHATMVYNDSNNMAPPLPRR